jgi:hypothetical protein
MSAHETSALRQKRSSKQVALKTELGEPIVRFRDLIAESGCSSHIRRLTMRLCRTCE